MTVAIQRNGQQSAISVKSMQLPPGYGGPNSKGFTVAVYKRKGTENYMMDFEAPGGRRVRKSTGTPDRKEALRREAVLRIELGAVFDIPGASQASEPITLGELSERFLAIKATTNPGSYKSHYLGSIGPFVKWAGFDREISTIRLKDLQAYQTFKLQDRTALNSINAARKCSPSNVNHISSVLKVFFRFAVDQGHLREDPTKGLKRFKQEKGNSIRFLKADEQKRLLEAASSQYRRLFLVAMRTGLRRIELLNLARHNLDFENNQIKLVSSKTKVVRYLPILPQIKEILLELVAKVATDNEPLFKAKNEKPFSIDAVVQAFTRARVAAGLKVRYHDLRHTFATDAVAAGIPVFVISKWLGHSSVKMTEIYTHLGDKQSQEAAEGMSRYLAAQSGTDTEEHRAA
jgi:integrase